MFPARKYIFPLAASLGVVFLLHLSLVIGNWKLDIPPVRAVEGTLELKADVASFSGTFTQAGNQPIRTAFGPLRLDYKSGPDTWSTGLLIREGDGNVTIGAGITSADFAATSKLRVLGIIESTTGGVKFPDGTTQTTAVSATAGLAQGAIIFYDGASCPTGYAEVTGARGRVVVGLPAAGTLAGTVGSGLTDLATRTIADVPAHTHSIDPTSTGTSTDGSHTHSVTAYRYANENSGRWAYGGNDAAGAGLTTGGSGVHSHTVDIAAFNSSSTGVSSVDVTMPYVQYIVCKASDGAGSAGNGWNDLGSTVVLATSGDSVGIGTTNVTSKLTVAGTVESTTGGFKFPDATTQTSAATAETAGQITFFTTACPSGWTEYTALRGRVTVGTPLSGTNASTVGTALTDLATRTITTVPAHTHAAGTLAADSAGAHTHSITTRGNFTGGDTGTGIAWTNDSSQTNSVGTSSNGSHTHTISGSTASTGSASVDVTMPYIQLTACQKN